jgi:hypothetical protein
VIARLANGITVTVLREAVTGRSAFGNDVRTATEVTYEGCASWPTTSEENQAAGGDTVTTGRVLLLPDGAQIAATDRVRLPDGSLWRVQGDPEQHLSVLTLARGSVRVALQRVTG